MTDQETIQRIYRSEIALFIASLGLLGTNLYLDAGKMKETWPVFLTHWHLLINVVCQGAVLKLAHKYCTASDMPSHRKNLQLVELKGARYGALGFDPRQFALTSSVLVSALFWTLLDQRKPIEITAHGAMAALYLLHSYANKLPYASNQGLFVVGLGLLYTLFSVAYACSSGYTYDLSSGAKLDYVYPQLDWKHHPGKAAVFAVVGTFFAVPLLVLGLSALKNLNFRWLCSAAKGKETSPLLVQSASVTSNELTACFKLWFGS